MPVLAADSLITQVESAYRGFKNLSADFVQTTRVEVMETTVEQSGRFTFEKTGKVRIQYLSPEKKEFISDGKTLWIYRPEDKTVERYNKIHDKVSREGLLFMEGWSHLSPDYQVRVDPLKRTLTLIPRDHDSLFKKILLTINSSGLAERVRLFPRNGNETEYRFSQIQTDQVLPDNFFKFKKP